jgi:anti-sigma regulatory factor (Ser/Thr protein kinase)
MNKPAMALMELHIRADARFIHIVISYAEQAALAMGLARDDADRLKLAAEEIFSYLSVTAAPRKEMQIKVRGGGHYIDLQFCFEPDDFNMKAFNLTFKPPVYTDSIPRETGLLIAARVVDHIKFSQSGKKYLLTLRKEKTYPPLSEISLPETRQLMEYSLRPPDDAELTLLVHYANRCYPGALLPSFFTFPGKVNDMIHSGDFHAVIAADRAGTVGGAFLWSTHRAMLSECYGPYIFGQEKGPEIARALVDACLGTLARSPVTGLLAIYYTPELPLEYFEHLGTLWVKPGLQEAVERSAYYREFQEDAAGTVWAHSLLEPFLARKYEELVFARDIRLIDSHSEMGSRSAVIWAENNRELHHVLLHPVWWGSDAHEALAAYRETLGKEKISNLLFLMDLGYHWHCQFTPALLDNGFEPRLIIPNAGKSDIVLFQHREDC